MNKILLLIVGCLLNVSLAANELVYFQFNENEGNTAVDYSGVGNNGILSSSMSFANTRLSILGYAAEFNNPTDRITVSNFSLPSDHLSISLWFYVNEYVNRKRDDRLFSKSSGVASNDHLMMLSTFAVGDKTRLRARLKTSAKTHTMIAEEGDILLNTWHHAAFVYDGDRARLFLNGKIVGTYTLTGQIISDPRVLASL